MKSRCMVILGIVFIVRAATLYGDGLNANGDWQAWYDVGASATSGVWKLKVEDEIRAGNNLRDLYYNHIDVGLTRTTLSWLDFGANFRQIEEKKNGTWETENRPYLCGILKWGLCNWSFTDRNRLEYRNIENAIDRWRYCNMLTVYPPIAMLDGAIKPYVADEMYEDLDGNGFEENRAYIGTECKFVDWLKGSIAYMWLAKYKSTEWVSSNVINLKLEALF